MLILLLTIFFPIPPTYTLSCLPCCSTDYDYYTQCASCMPVSPSECLSGELTKGVCGCCDECAKAEGEECGGLWGLAGTCAKNLYCEDSYQEYDEYYMNYEMPGICKPVHQGLGNSDCCNKKIVKASQDVYILHKTSGMRALTVCLDSCVYTKEGDNSGHVYCFKQGNMDVECQ